jgi:hypothetical protein
VIWIGESFFELHFLFFVEVVPSVLFIHAFEFFWLILVDHEPESLEVTCEDCNFLLCRHVGEEIFDGLWRVVAAGDKFAEGVGPGFFYHQNFDRTFEVIANADYAEGVFVGHFFSRQVLVFWVCKRGRAMSEEASVRVSEPENIVDGDEAKKENEKKLMELADTRVLIRLALMDENSLMDQLLNDGKLGEKDTKKWRELQSLLKRLVFSENQILRSLLVAREKGKN